MQFNESLINIQDPVNEETLGTEYPNENDSEYTETNKNSVIPNFIPEVPPDDEIAEALISLKSL